MVQEICLPDYAANKREAILNLESCPTSARAVATIHPSRPPCSSTQNAIYSKALLRHLLRIHTRLSRPRVRHFVSP